MTASAAIDALQGLAGFPLHIASFNAEATRRELESAYGVKLATGQPSWRGRRAVAPPASEAVFILTAPASCSAILDSLGRCRPVVDGKIAVNGIERAALLGNAGWADA